MSYKDFVLSLTLQKYLKGELNEYANTIIREGAEEIVLQNWLVYIVEIAYGIGYLNSLLIEKISSSTYKIAKKEVKENLIKKLSQAALFEN